jgi:hypothetical protein
MCAAGAAVELFWAARWLQLFSVSAMCAGAGFLDSGAIIAAAVLEVAWVTGAAIVVSCRACPYPAPYLCDSMTIAALLRSADASSCLMSCSGHCRHVHAQVLWIVLYQTLRCICQHDRGVDETLCACAAEFALHSALGLLAG